jgi:hypothetical protein
MQDPHRHIYRAPMRAPTLAMMHVDSFLGKQMNCNAGRRTVIALFQKAYHQIHILQQFLFS